MPSATPLRSLGHLDGDGLRILSDPDLGYADGAEGRLAEIVGAADDVSSASAELAGKATDWPTSYSLVPSRANLLRGLDLHDGLRVLEIGCGCGPISRYLGERAGLVDSVEPMPARARVARLRTRDLDTVQVYVGTLEDVPREPTYDVVVVVGVLEYVGGGGIDPAPYLDFLRRCHDVLVEGGTLVLAIENALGVKYVAGAGEDHTNRPFDSLEGYLLPSPARTFSREVLTGLVAEAGLSPSVLSAFPDYKLPRVLMSDELFERSPGLAERLPRFPSPDWVVPRLPVVDEELLWRTLVGAGVGPTFANSFVVLAVKGTGPDLWPQDRLGVLFAGERQLGYAVRTEVVATPDGVQLRRSSLHPHLAGDLDETTVRHRPPAVEQEVRGRELLAVAVQEPERRGELLRGWAALVPDAEWMPMDLVPHNVLVRPDGTLAAVDQEWSCRGVDRSSVLVRGLLWAAVRIALTTRREPDAPPRTVRDLVEEMAAEIGLDLTDAVIQRFVAEESSFQAAVNTTDDDEADRRRRSAQDLYVVLSQDLTDVRGGDRLDARWQKADAERAAATARVAEQDQRIASLTGELERVRAELEASAEELQRVYRRLQSSVDERVRQRVGPVLRRARLLR